MSNPFKNLDSINQMVDSLLARNEELDTENKRLREFNADLMMRLDLIRKFTKGNDDE